MVSLVLIGVEHVFQEGIVAHLAWTLVVVGVREQCIKAEADQEGFAHLSKRELTSLLE